MFLSFRITSLHLAPRTWAPLSGPPRKLNIRGWIFPGSWSGLTIYCPRAELWAEIWTNNKYPPSNAEPHNGPIFILSWQLVIATSRAQTQALWIDKTQGALTSVLTSWLVLLIFLKEIRYLSIQFSLIQTVKFWEASIRYLNEDLKKCSNCLISHHVLMYK